MRIASVTALTIAVVAMACSTAHAQPTASRSAPSRMGEGNIEFVVGAGAGGENDRIARAIGRALVNARLVDSVTVLNRPGAAQTIAINTLAGRTGDPRSVGLASGSFVNAIARSGSTLHKNVTPIMKLFDAYQCYFAKAGSAIRSMHDVRDRLRADPRTLTFAFPVGHGSPLHVSAVNVGKAAGVLPSQVITVVYNSGADVSAQIAGGHVDVGITSLGSAMPMIEGGNLAMLGIAAPARMEGDLARYPTLREQGLDVVTANSYTVLVPNGLSPEQIKFWTDALDTVLLDPEFKIELERNYWLPQPIRYPATIKWLQDDYDENRAILKELGLITG